MTKLLIDGDVIAYRAGFASEKTKYLVTRDAPDGAGMSISGYADDHKTAKSIPGDLWSRKEVQPEDQALMIADIMVKDIKEHYASENPTCVVYLSGVGNFRHSVATRASYKGNRSGSVPPVHLKAIRNHLIARGAIVSVGEEADDLLGIAATAAPGSVICSVDKDLLQVHGRHYNFVTKEEVTISPKQAVLNFYAQVLSGDAVDNVPGLTGIGPVKAKKALEDCKSPLDCWQTALRMYNEEFGATGYDFAVEAARLVFVRRKEGEIWQPPTEQLSNDSGVTLKKARSAVPYAELLGPHRLLEV